MSRLLKFFTIRRVLLAALLLVMVVIPFYVDSSWLLIGSLSMAAAVSAIGLTILVGRAGLLSLAHGFFMAVGAYSYAMLAADGAGLFGLGLPSWLAMIGGVAAAGFAGLLFSPIAARVRGLYLGLASLALIFIGQHILSNVKDVTGGANGRDIPVLSVAGIDLSGADPTIEILGIPFGPRERMWFLCLVILVLAYFFAKNIVDSRPGRAMALMRDSSSAASAMGVPVQQYKAKVFVLSSVYAGVGGVLVSLAFEYVVPQYFGLALSLDFLAMIVIGGMGSIGGAIAGATFVIALPLILDRLSGVIPFISPPGAGGLEGSVLARMIFAVTVVLVLVFWPKGVAGAVTTIARRKTAKSQQLAAENLVSITHLTTEDGRSSETKKETGE